MKTRFATFLGALIKQVPKFDEVFYVKVKKILATKKPCVATIFFFNIKSGCFATGVLR